MQIIDNLLVVHNLDEKATQIYDFKIQEYSNPLIGPNLNVDTSLASRNIYVSQNASPEDKGASTDQFKGLGGMTEQVTQLYGASAASIVNQTEMTTGMENSKEFIEFNFKVKYTDDDNEPVQALLDIPVESKAQIVEETKVALPEIDIYDQTAIFVAPMHIL